MAKGLKISVIDDANPDTVGAAIRGLLEQAGFDAAYDSIEHWKGRLRRPFGEAADGLGDDYAWEKLEPEHLADVFVVDQLNEHGVNVDDVVGGNFFRPLQRRSPCSARILTSHYIRPARPDREALPVQTWAGRCAVSVEPRGGLDTAVRKPWWRLYPRDLFKVEDEREDEEFKGDACRIDGVSFDLSPMPTKQGLLLARLKRDLERLEPLLAFEPFEVQVMPVVSETQPYLQMLVDLAAGTHRMVENLSSRLKETAEGNTTTSLAFARRGGARTFTDKAAGLCALLLWAQHRHGLTVTMPSSPVRQGWIAVRLKAGEYRIWLPRPSRILALAPGKSAEPQCYIASGVQQRKSDVQDKKSGIMSWKAPQAGWRNSIDDSNAHDPFLGWVSNPGAADGATLLTNRRDDSPNLSMLDAKTLFGSKGAPVCWQVYTVRIPPTVFHIPPAASGAASTWSPARIWHHNDCSDEPDEPSCDPWILHAINERQRAILKSHFPREGDLW